MQSPSTPPSMGPLEPYVTGFRQHLTDAGYCSYSVAKHLKLMAAFSAWWEANSAGPGALSELGIRGFLASWQGERLSARSLQPLVDYLEGRGLIPEAAAPTATEMLLSDYHDYLVNERGLMALTVANYMAMAAKFLAAHEDRVLMGLGAGDVTGFLSRAGRGLSARTVNEKVVRLRSLLRYLYLKGLVGAPLAQAALWLAGSRASSLPRALERGTAAQLLAGCDRSTLVGARDFAIITVLARLGLRAGEVCALRLDDIDWRAGEVTVRGKGARYDKLPLPADVGAALASYLQLRGPEPVHREVFLQVVAPAGPLKLTAVCAVVRRACERAGIAGTGTHRFRHGAATEMLAKGAPLYEIGQPLRHGDFQTTAIYAKVDFAALAAVAQPWPGISE